MPKLPSIRAREVARVAQQIGFAFDRQRGSHAVYYRSSDSRRIVIPMHGNKDLKPGTLRAIINVACSPNLDPPVMRVFQPIKGKEILDECQSQKASFTRSDHRAAA